MRLTRPRTDRRRRSQFDDETVGDLIAPRTGRGQRVDTGDRDEPELVLQRVNERVAAARGSAVTSVGPHRFEPDHRRPIAQALEDGPVARAVVETAATPGEDGHGQATQLDFVTGQRLFLRVGVDAAGGEERRERVGFGHAGVVQAPTVDDAGQHLERGRRWSGSLQV